VPVLRRADPLGEILRVIRIDPDDRTIPPSCSAKAPVTSRAWSPCCGPKCRSLPPSLTGRGPFPDDSDEIDGRPGAICAPLPHALAKKPLSEISTRLDA
jgi:hypothetical protein